jgi:signal peptidase I
VPPDRLFELGDNRPNSLDSRVAEARGGVGYVPVDNLVGRAEFRFFSLAESGSLLRFWSLPFSIRYDRLLTEIR